MITKRLVLSMVTAFLVLATSALWILPASGG